jgi:Type I phosphodiesterase / nucleotide pyrophosphatase
MRFKKTAISLLVGFALGAATGAFAGDSSTGDSASIKHVLLISVDGLHQDDLVWYVTNNPGSTLARLVREGVEYTNARTPFPSDSFPGMVGQVTGGNPTTTGIYYDDAYSRDLLPVGTTKATCATTAKGAEVFYAEVIARDLARIDSGQGIPGLYKNGVTDLSQIYQLTGHPLDLIDPALLPVDPKSCDPVYPHQYLKVNTVFEIAHANHLHTAWSDKHAAYEILSGPSGQGIDDLFAPEINSNVADPSSFGPPGTPNYGSGPDWTKDNTDTQRYDAVKAQAVINWIHGFDHAGNNHPGTPAIFGMNFQAVSTAQKLNTSNYYPDPNHPNMTKFGLGGYISNGTIPGPVLQSALDFVNDKLTDMVNAIDRSNTAIILSAKHGQSPQNRADLTIINDGNMIDALNIAWDPTYKTDGTLPLVAHAIDDDGILMWLNDRSKKATTFAKNFLLNYSGAGIGSDAAGNSIPKPFNHAGVTAIYAGKDAADLFDAKQNDGRVPDLVGIAQHGVVWAGSKLSKIAEHGGAAEQDRHVPIVVWGPNIQHNAVSEPVATTQIAPSILQLLGLDPESLQAVREEGTEVLPQLREND